MRISIPRLTMLCCLLLTQSGFSSYATAQIQFFDDFESYNLYVGPTGYEGEIGAWKAYANVFTDYPGCSALSYSYGAFPTPNKDSGFSNITLVGASQALNVFSDYDNVDHANGRCIETSVFREVTVSAADAGSYTFGFSTAPPLPLGAGVVTFGFIKLLDPNNGYYTEFFDSVSTATGGSKSIAIDLDATADGKLLQWGFTTKASNYVDSSRVYDNVSFGPTGAPPVGPGSGIVPDDSLPSIPIPAWALLLTVGLLAYLGGRKLRARKDT